MTKVVLDKVQFKRGVEAKTPLLDPGEPFISTDTQKFVIGTPAGNVEITRKKDLDEVSSSLAKIANVLNFLPNTDITAELNNRIANLTSGRIKIPNGTFLVDASVGINLMDNITLELSENTVLKVIPNSLDSYKILNLTNVENVKVIGGTLQGDRNEHTGTTGEFGHGLYMLGCTDCTIDNVTITNCWGDGLYANTLVNCKINVKVDNARRNGISIIAAIDTEFINPYITNVGGTDPQYGIDIEPNGNGDKLQNVKIINPVIKNCARVGIGISFVAKTAADTVGIEIINPDISHSAGNINTKAIQVFNAASYLKGYIDIIKPKTKGLKHFELRANESDGIRFRLLEPYVEDWNPSANTDVYGSGIMVYADSNDPSTLGTVGNVLIENPTFALINQTSNYALSIMDRRSSGAKAVKNVQVIKPRFVGNQPVNPIYQFLQDTVYNDVLIDNGVPDIPCTAFTEYQYTYWIPANATLNLQFANGGIIPSDTKLELLVEGYTEGLTTSTGAIALFTFNGASWTIISVYADTTSATYNPQFVLDANGKPSIKHGDTANGKYIAVKHTMARPMYNSKINAAGGSSVLTQRIKPLLNALVGTTAQRPTQYFVGQQYYDTTLNKPIYVKNPFGWVDSAGNAV